MSIEFLEFVEHLMQRGVPRDKAELAARKEFGLPTQLEQSGKDANRDALQPDPIREPSPE